MPRVLEACEVLEVVLRAPAVERRAVCDVEAAVRAGAKGDGVAACEV